jgi:oxidase EvaA
MNEIPINPTIRESSFLYSALTESNRFLSLKEFMIWFKTREEENQFEVNHIPFSKLDKWKFEEDTGNLVHDSGKFFKIKGIRVGKNFGRFQQWDQPVIDQPEIGILGILTKNFNGVRYFLMQAKMEPGNIGPVQLSPTVQATKSNYTRAHKGKAPLYIEYFLDKSKSKVLIDQLQTEHGARFIQKRNRNIIVETDEDIPMHEDFCWLTLGQIKQLMKLDNLVNMDARSVISCIPFVGSEVKRYYDSVSERDFFNSPLLSRIPEGFQRDLFISLIDDSRVINTYDDIINWFTDIKANCEVEFKQIPLNRVRDWIIGDQEIKHKDKKFFSVIAVEVKASNREVTSWTQPLIRYSSNGLIGFVVKKINGVLHFLVQARVDPCNYNVIEIAPTVACTESDFKLDQSDKHPFLDMFTNPDDSQVRYSSMQSDEGGRFYQSQNKHIVIEVPQTEKLDLPFNYLWVTYGQIIEMVKHNYFNIDTRGMIACLSFI